jgi:hypothetical protein
MKSPFQQSIHSVGATALIAFVVSSLMLHGQNMPADYDQVLKTLGKQGDFKANVLKINIPRNDLKVTVDGVATPTPFGFGGWLAMTKGTHGDVMMGDLVLTQDEVNPVMSALLDHGLEVTALHNHFFFEEPRVFYMHVMGHGTPRELASMAKPALDLIGHGLGSHSSAGTTASSDVHAGSMDTAQLAKIAGHDGEQTGPVYKITVGRDDLQIREMGALINARMGLNTWAAFFGTDQQAVVAGDVAMLESELQPVLKALRSHKLEVVAIHQHMMGTHPEILFLHYWGKGPATQLADGFRAALDQLGKNAKSANTTARR